MKSKRHSRNAASYNEVTDEDNEKNYLLCGIICTKSIVIIFNFLFIISGILIILLGLWTIATKFEYSILTTSVLYQASAYILIMAGGMIVLTGIMGILSAWFESKNFIILFIIFCIIIFATEITAGILALTFSAQLNESLKNDLQTFILKDYGEKGFEKKTQKLDDLQVAFKCCGATNYLDWEESSYVKASNSSASAENNFHFNLVAESCCKTPSKLCAKRDHPSNINYNGCVPSLENYIKKHIILLGVVGVGSCFFQAIGILFAALLIRRINQRSHYSHLKTDGN